MIAIACDHAAHGFKSQIMKHLDSLNVEYMDCGAFDPNTAVDYPDYALIVAEKVASGECQSGILICGTGIGMSIAANKVKGIRCAVCGDVFSAKATRLHNDANVLALGERVIGVGLALEIVDAFINTEFSCAERHCNRIKKIAEVEAKYCK